MVSPQAATHAATNARPARRAHPRLTRARYLITHRALPGLLALLLVLGLLRLALPGIVLREINSRLAVMGDYSGHVADVDLALWRGNYSLRGLEITKRDGEVPVPLLDAPATDIHLSWRDLIHGGIVAEVLFERPVVHLVHGESAQDNQTGTGVDWRARLENIIPIRLNGVEIRDGTLVFHNFVSNPQVDLSATRVNGDISNLTNVRDDEGDRVAEMKAEAVLFDSGRVESEARFDPFGRPDTFYLALRVLGIELTELNEFAQAYANLDFESGNGELVLELEAEEGQLAGYAKPLFQHLKILSWENDSKEAGMNPLELAWEVIAEVVTEIFTNQPAEQFGTRVEINGDIDDPDVSTFEAVVGILRNAFIEAFNPYFEGTSLGRRERE